MNCQQIEPLFSKYLDQELNIQETASVYEHLQSCSICKEEWESFQKWDHALHLVLANHPFQGVLSHKIMSQVEKKPLPVPARRPTPLLRPWVKNFAWAASFLLFFTLAIYFFALETPSSPSLTMVSKIQGQKGVLLFRNSSKIWISCEKKDETMALFSGDSIWNQGVEPFEVSLSDQSRIVLGKDSQIRVQKNDGTWNLEMGEIGKIFFHVAKQRERTFQVKARNVAIVVVGTAFLVEMEPKEVGTTVFEGKVQMVRKFKKDSYLTPGQSMVISSITSREEIFSLNETSYLEKIRWISNFIPDILQTKQPQPEVSEQNTPSIPQKNPIQRPLKIEPSGTPIPVKKR